MREQLSLFQREYAFYKDIAEGLEAKNGTQLQEATMRLKELAEREKDFLA